MFVFAITTLAGRHGHRRRGRGVTGEVGGGASENAGTLKTSVAHVALLSLLT